ncbi:hypothetical protein [Paenibacillus cineris]|uniref:hypothetical protein n=1 Tax=Paenibacillus cineris TaxID=237530 RepID=UPI001B004BD4|nr:hypothetical protein [Paenibacillus cineris]GIO63558.1 hypothetical protein J43TS9_51320 [Paenibacillus cineris]
MSDNRDWQKDKETIKYLQSWRLDPGGTEDSAAFYTIENDVYTDTKADGMLLEDARTLNDAFLALEHYHKQYAVEKAQADYWREATRQGNIELEAAEAREQKLKEAIKKSLTLYHYDGFSDEEAVEAIRDELEAVMASLYPVMDKEAEA